VLGLLASVVGINGSERINIDISSVRDGWDILMGNNDVRYTHADREGLEAIGKGIAVLIGSGPIILFLAGLAALPLLQIFCPRRRVGAGNIQLRDGSWFQDPKVTKRGGLM
jgi:hypothetical protein